MRLALDPLDDGAVAADALLAAEKVTDTGTADMTVVGPASLDGELDPRLGFAPADQSITSDDDPEVAARGRRSSSLRVALDLLVRGDVDAVVSLGPTAAVVAAARFVLGPVRGVSQPVLATSIGVGDGTVVTVADAGANRAPLPVSLAHALDVLAPDVAGVLSPMGDRSLHAAVAQRDDGARIRPVTVAEVFDGEVDLVLTAGIHGHVLVEVARALGCTVGPSRVLGVDGTVFLSRPDDVERALRDAAAAAPTRSAA